MIAKRLRTGLVAFGLVALGMVAIELAPAVRAEDPPPRVMPHGKYGADTELCAVCHDWHVKPNQDLYPDTLASFPWEQLLTEPSELELCYTCHDGSGADPDANVESDFGDPDRNSSHPVLAPADDILLACSDCHAQHQDPLEDVKLLYREMSPGEYLPFTDPIGDTFCYGCHGDDTLPADALPAPFGDHSAFETSIHDDSGGVEPPTPGTDLKCSACHEPHASDYRYLTRANEEELCYTCHASADNSVNGSNPQDAFTAVPNDYEPVSVDGDGIQIFHHPIANDGDQAGGARTVECASCHNSHLVTRTETAADPAGARAMDSGWRFNWIETSGDYYRSARVTDGTTNGVSSYAAEFCGTCHISPGETEPLTSSVDVPYDVRLVYDEAHDKFDLSWFLEGSDSAHGNPQYEPDASGDPSYPGCPPGEPCELACTACHDFHGSSNAYMLRENIASPDYGPLEVTAATWAIETATLTVGPHGILAGWYVTVIGTSGYDGTWPVTAVTADTISFALAADPGTFTSGGTLSTRIEGYGGLNVNSDRKKLQAFCLTCHPEQLSTHGLVDGDGNTTLCTSCHNHDPATPEPF